MTRIAHLLDTAANWTSRNSLLLAGELGFESDTGKSKLGDGVTLWNALAYRSSSDKLGLTFTASKSSAYPAAAGDMVRCNASSAFTVTLPTAPADGSVVGVIMTNQTASNAVTVAVGGSDVFDKAAGPTSKSLTAPNTGFVWQYNAASAVWYQMSTIVSAGGSSGLPDPGGNGLVARTALNTDAARTLTAGSTKVTVSNGDGVAGNPTIDVAPGNIPLDTLGVPGSDVPFNGHKATGLADPTSAQDAATRAYVLAQIAALIASAPGALDTLNELATALGDDPNFATTVTNALAAKAPIASPTFTGTTTAPEFSASGLPGATAASRYVGATASGAPTTGTFAVGDFVIDRTGKILVCTTAGSPGTWTQIGVPAGVLNDLLGLSFTEGDFLHYTGGHLVNLTPSAAATALGIPATLNVLLGSVDVPPRSLDRFRGAPNFIDSFLSAAITSTTQTTINVVDYNLTAKGENPILQIDSEKVLVIRGQGTTSLVVRRGVLGSTIATHSSGSTVIRDKVRHVAILADSTGQTTLTSTAGMGAWDTWSDRLRKLFNERFGGLLGAGFQASWRSPHATYPSTEYDGFGGGTPIASTDAKSISPWATCALRTTHSDGMTWTRSARTHVGQVDVITIATTASQGHSAQDFSYSTDGGTTWLDNPDAAADTFPTATTTLAGADAGRRCDYWDGTKTMTLASTAGLQNNAGFFLVDVGSGGGTMKCRAKFSYDGVSGSTLTNVKYEGPAYYNALTTTSGDTAQRCPELRRTAIVCLNPTDFRVRSGTAAGTDKTTAFVGLDIWSSPPVFGVTRGIKLHNFGNAGNTLANFIGARTVTDIGTTNGSPTITSLARAAFTSADVGALVVNANVPAGTIITAVASGTSATMSANATATVVAGNVSNPTTIQNYGNSWEEIFNGSPASYIPSLVLECCWTNDMSGSIAQNGGDATLAATFANGSNAVTITSGNAIETLDVGQLFRDTAAAATAAGTVIASRVDATHITISPAAVGSATAVAANLCAPSAAVATAMQHRLDILHNGGVGGKGVSAYADALLVVPWEQGGGRVNGLSNTAATQADYRDGMHAWATANKRASIDLYRAYAAEGAVGYAACLAAGLMDDGSITGDLAQLHEGQVGMDDVASRISRTLEFA